MGYCRWGVLFTFFFFFWNWPKPKTIGEWRINNIWNIEKNAGDKIDIVFKNCLCVLTAIHLQMSDKNQVLIPLWAAMATKIANKQKCLICLCFISFRWTTKEIKSQGRLSIDSFGHKNMKVSAGLGSSMLVSKGGVVGGTIDLQDLHTYCKYIYYWFFKL